MSQSTSAITCVPGFRAIGVTCGLKQSGNPDLALIVADGPCVAAAVFTKNLFKAAPVLYDMALLERTSQLQAIITNAGNANAVTGEQGLRDAERMARMTEEACQLAPDSVFVMSTGIIGAKMAMDKVEQGIQAAAAAIKTEAGHQGRLAAQAIMTTDLVPKEAFAQVEIAGKNVSLGGMAKGSGMIHPNMGTMLSALVTDAAITPQVLHTALKHAANHSFNRVTVDGDTSTNDTLVILASGAANNPTITEAHGADYDAFVSMLTAVCVDLAKAIARDGEGATKLVEITVRGALSEIEAETAAKTVATSPLFKTAIFGNDPNWGRALAAIGRSNVSLKPNKVSLWLGDFLLVDNGEPQPFEAKAVHNWLAESTEVALVVQLGMGQAEASVWSCDFSYKYVEINAEYHT